jgi:hypothetical protein
LPEASCLSNLGLSVITRYPDGSERDITSHMSFGVNISELEDGRIMLSFRPGQSLETLPRFFSSQNR